MSRNFGEVTIEDFNYVFKPEPDAAAIVLYDIGETRFVIDHGELLIKHTRRKKVRIVNEKGVEYGEIAIPYYVDGYGKTESITDIKAYSYNLDGKIHVSELQPTSIFQEQQNKSWYVKKFVIPNVKAGSVIEFEYLHTTPFIFNLPDWEFQSTIPTVYSKYVARMIPFYEYIYIAQGITNFTYHSSEESKGLERQIAGVKFQDMINTYVMENVSSFKDESYISSKEDYIMKLDFQLSKVRHFSGGEREVMTTWPKASKDLLGHDNFGKYINKSEKLAQDILESELDLSGMNEIEKSKAVINYVRSHFTWNGSKGKYADEKPKDLLKNKSGSVGDINLFLIAMLRAAGLEAKPVILSTRAHGKINANYPFVSMFNYVIPCVAIGEGYFLTDGTVQHLRFNRIPVKCINGMGLLIDKKNPIWIDLYNTIESVDNKVMKIELQEGVDEGMVTFVGQSNEYVSYLLKNKCQNDSIRLKKAYKDVGILEATNVTTRNYEAYNKNYVIRLNGKTPIDRFGKKILVSPFLDFFEEENPFSQKVRTYPVDFVIAKAENYLSSVVYPEGYKLTFIPEDLFIDDDIMTLSITFKQTDLTVVAVAKYKLKKVVYEPEDYELLKEDFGKVVNKFNEQIAFETESH